MVELNYKLLTFIFISSLTISLNLVSADYEEFGYNNLDQPQLSKTIINYTTKNVNNSILWDGNAYADEGHWETDGTDVWRTGGNLGLKTSTPRSLLDLNGSGGVSSGITLQNSNERFEQYFSTDAVNSPFVMTYSGSGGADIQINHDGDIILAQGGDLGVGVEPEAKLHIQSTSTDVNYLILERDLNSADTELGILFKDRKAIAGGQEVARIWTDRQGSTGNFDLVFQGGDQGSGGLQPSESIRIVGNTGHVRMSKNLGLGGAGVTEQLNLLNGDIELRGESQTSSIQFYREDPTINIGNNIGQIVWGGSDDADVASAGAIVGRAGSAAWTATSSPTEINIYTTPVGSTTQLERVVIADDGQVGGGNIYNPTASLHFGVNGTGDVFQFERVDANGWFNLHFGNQWTNFDSDNLYRWMIDGVEKLRVTNDVVNVVGDLNVSGNATYNSYYGGINYHNHAGYELTFGTENYNYTLFMTEGTYTNGMIPQDIGVGLNSSLQVLERGLYQVVYHATGDGENNDVYRTSVFIGDLSMESCDSHKKMTAGGDILTMPGNCFLRLEAGQNVSLKITNEDGTGIGNYYGANLNLVRVGD